MDDQAGDGVPAAVESTGEIKGIASDRRKTVAKAATPTTGAGGVDVGAEEIVAVQVILHALQVSARFAAYRAQAGDNGVVLAVDGQEADAGTRAEVHFTPETGSGQAVVDGARAARAAGHDQLGRSPLRSACR